MVNCKWCGRLTLSESLRECPGCWEVRSRIEDNPQLARKIMDTGLKRKILCFVGIHSMSQVRVDHPVVYEQCTYCTASHIYNPFREDTEHTPGSNAC